MGRKGLFAVAILIVAVGFGLLGSLTSAQPAAIEEATTTSTTIGEVLPPVDLENFSVDQIQTGPQLDWETTLSVVEGYPLALLHHREMLFLFSTDVPNFSGFDSGGLRAWRSTDGATWEPLGQVIDPSHTITAVTSTEQGLVALESTAGRSGFTVWESPSGEEWTSEEVVLDMPGELTTAYPVAAGGTQSVLVVTGHISIDVGALLRERLGDSASYGWGVDVLGDEVQITLHGPLGWAVAAVPADDLGLSQEEQERIVDAYRAGSGSSGHVWVRREASSWQQTAIEGAWIERITTEPDGTIVGHGWGNTGEATWRSTDGLSWEETPSGRYELEERWGDRVVALDREGGASVLISGNGQDWEDIGPDEYFPDGIEWWITGLAAGTNGIAAIVSGWNPRQAVTSADLPSPPSITSNGSTLTLDVSSSELRLERGEDTHIWRPTYSTTPPEGIEFDLDTTTIRFLDRETDELLAVFSIDEFMDLENRAISDRQPVDYASHQAFAFTANGADWTIQETASTEDNIFHLLAVTDSHIVATDHALGGFYTPASPPGFEVWSADIP